MERYTGQVGDDGEVEATLSELEGTFDDLEKLGEASWGDSKLVKYKSGDFLFILNESGYLEDTFYQGGDNFRDGY